MAIKLTVHYQYIITFIFTSLDIRILRYRIRRIKIDNSFILIRLFRFNKNPVLIQSVIFRVYIFNEKEFFCWLIKFLISQHAIFNEYFYIIPFFFERFTIISKHLIKFLRNFLRYIRWNLLHLLIRLKIASTHIERDIRWIYDTLHQSHKFRHNSFHLISDIDLITI